MYFRCLNYLIILLMILLIEYVGFKFFYPWSKPVVIARIAPENIKRVMIKMGPYYDYKEVEGKLYVNRGDGKWLRLRY